MPEQGTPYIYDSHKAKRNLGIGTNLHPPWQRNLLFVIQNHNI